MLKLIFIFNLKNKEVGVDFDFTKGNLDAIYKMTVEQ